MEMTRKVSMRFQVVPTSTTKCPLNCFQIKLKKGPQRFAKEAPRPGFHTFQKSAVTSQHQGWRGGKKATASKCGAMKRYTPQILRGRSFFILGTYPSQSNMFWAYDGIKY